MAPRGAFQAAGGWDYCHQAGRKVETYGQEQYELRAVVSRLTWPERAASQSHPAQQVLPGRAQGWELSKVRSAQLSRDLLEAMESQAGRTGPSKSRVVHSSSLARPPLAGRQPLGSKTSGESRLIAGSLRMLGDHLER